jgi:hypothetical protein
MHEDEKALDLSFKDTWEYMGKPRQIGRTNLAIRMYLKKILRQYDQLEEIINQPFNETKIEGMDKEGNPVYSEKPDIIFEKKLKEVMKEAQKIVKQIVSPMTKEDLDYISIEDLEELDRILTRRTLLRRGFTRQEILDMESKQREIYKSFLDKGTEIMNENDKDKGDVEGFPLD